jgi:hypothetical protein
MEGADSNRTIRVYGMSERLLGDENVGEKISGNDREEQKWHYM